MLGFVILLGFNVLGVLAKSFLLIPLPANVIGLVLFVIALSMKWIRLEWVEEVSEFLLKHLMLFFAPFIVGIISVAALMKTEWLAIVAGITLSTVISMAVTGAVTQLSLKKEVKPHE